jgi:hypothetical protein
MKNFRRKKNGREERKGISRIQIVRFNLLLYLSGRTENFVVKLRDFNSIDDVS